VVEVQVKEKESFERALRRFKKMWERAGVLREIRTRSFYEKPSDAKREARKKTVRRVKRQARIDAMRNDPRASRQRRRKPSSKPSRR
jgi:small subunit ribosomal protein S21|tara:strand:+ start:19338 stop:19598 length:261 start_codon:yes stop_codon:yes gene_type:complete